ncbi:pyridoxamine 5'-phosphate oxidase family protein [Alphaproteobacteria bacterium KMM 3653]|uniref:Pyridoxamine 5'-phosphate oxidase family protein n=1 Tax=Harenicola maris TaxID=2841044 RepID=A0AAP2CMH7_9RHOB|nr:pyridoxamine 5'-phosphate oxidase family protein [Harenicola maris]
MTQWIENLEELEGLYGSPKPAALRKVTSALTPEYARLIAASPFCALATVGPEGTDCSPRGDEGPVVSVLDPSTLALPDWRGNDRIDTLRNVVRDPRVSLMFLIPGSGTVMRCNGRGRLTADPAITGPFERGGILPRSVLVITLQEVYFQCSRAVMRSGLWSGKVTPDLPKPGEVLAAITEGEVGGPDYDAKWPERAAKTMW